MYIDCESVYSSRFSCKTDGEKLIRYLCFIPVDFIHSCYHRLKKSNFILEKNRFRLIDLTCWRSTNHCVYDSQLPWTRVLERSRVFWSKGGSSLFETFPSFQISWICSDVFQMNEKFIHNCPPCLLPEMTKVASSVVRPRKYYINRLERFIERLIIHQIFLLMRDWPKRVTWPNIPS